MPSNKRNYAGDEDVEGHGLKIQAAGLTAKANTEDEDVEGHGLKILAAGLTAKANTEDEDDVEGHARRL